jgi:hypothetical protein
MKKVFRKNLLLILCAGIGIALLVGVNLRAYLDTEMSTEPKVGIGQLMPILQLQASQKELALTEEQIRKLAVINSNSPGLPFSEAIEPFKTLLTDEQLKKFKRTVFQGMGVRAFTVYEVQDSLGLTPDQKTTIAAIQSNLKSKLQPFQDQINRGKDVDPVELDRDTKAFHEEAYVEALGLLTTEQSKKWEEIARPVPLRN